MVMKTQPCRKRHPAWNFIWKNINPYYINIICPQIEHLLRIMFSHKATIILKERWGLWIPQSMTIFPLRFLAGHCPTCCGLFPAPSIVPEIKWHLFSFERETLLQRPFSDSSQRHLYSNTSVDHYDIFLHWSFMNQLCGQSGALLCQERRKIETVLEYNITQLSPLFCPKSLTSTLTERDEA